MAGAYPAVMLQYIAERKTGTDAMWSFINESTSQVVNGVADFDQFVFRMTDNWNTPDQLQLVKLTAFLRYHNLIATSPLTLYIV